MSQKARTDATKPGIPAAEPEGTGWPDTITAAELETIRQRLAEGFYEREEIMDTVVEAVRKELDSTQPPA